MEINSAFQQVNFFSKKYAIDLAVYQFRLQKYSGLPVTLVEVGVFEGGSLEMWRNFLGAEARIIGIDANPRVKDLDIPGVEIYIGDQSNPKFWNNFFSEIGKIDILIDDGGHTNKQQILTVEHAIPNIKDGGVILVEDTHFSFSNEVGNPNKNSFINYAKLVAENLSKRYLYKNIDLNNYTKFISSVEFFDSVCIFNFERELIKNTEVLTSGGRSKKPLDFRHRNVNSLLDHSSKFVKKRSWLYNFYIKLKLNVLLGCILNYLYPLYWKIYYQIENKKLNKYFHELRIKVK